MSYTIKTKNTESVIRLSKEKPNSGATANVYNIEGTDGFVFKEYKKGAVDIKIFQPKLEHFIKNPPKFSGDDEEVLGIKFHPLAWPKHLVYKNKKVAGFLMPRVRFDESFALNRILSQSNRKKEGITEDINWRILVAKNLAATYAALHAEKYYVIDTKPANIRAYKKFQGITLLDCDGFMLGGSPFSAGHISDEYISPEFDPKNLDKIARQQDVFALSILIFRIFNNNIHPFSGVLKSKVDLKTQDRIKKGAYPYGSSVCDLQDPNPSSIHHLFPEKLAKMFDDIFGNGSRPEASEWVDLLESLRDSRAQVSCSKHLIKTFKKGCGLCELEKITGAQKDNSGEKEKESSDFSGPWSSTNNSNAQTYTPAKKSSNNGLLWIIGIVGALMLLAAIPDGSNKTSTSRTNNYSSNSSSSSQNYSSSSSRICANTPTVCDTTELCNRATLNGKWETRAAWIGHAKEAKRRGLSCGVKTASGSSQGSNSNSNPNSITLRANGQWTELPGKCERSQTHSNSHFPKTAISVYEDGVRFILYTNKYYQLNSNDLVIKVDGKQPFKVPATRYTGQLHIRDLTGLLNIFIKYNKFTISDGARSVTVPLIGSARAIQDLKNSKCIK